MCHKDEGDADFALQRLQFDLHLPAQIGVQSRKRFIEQQQSRTIDQRAGQRNALLLAAADLRWLRASRTAAIFTLSRASATRCAISASGRFATRNPYANVLFDGQVRKQCVVLKDGVHAATVRRLMVEPSRRPSTASPEVACSKPAMIRSRVVLPEPLSPRIVRNSPSRDFQRNVSKDGVPPKRLGHVAYAQQ